MGRAAQQLAVPTGRCGEGDDNDCSIDSGCASGARADPCSGVSGVTASAVTLPPVTGDDSRRPPAKRESDVVGRSTIAPYLFLLPGLLLFAIFFIWPAISAIQIAFYRYNFIDPPTFVGLDNFDKIWTDPEFWQVLKNSAYYLVGLLPFAIVLPLMLAIVVNRPLRGIRAFRAIYFLPVITSMVAVAVAWNYVFDDLGLLNGFLQWLGIINEPIHFILDPDWALPSLILVEGWKGMGTYMMIFLAGLQTIPEDLYEAARVDGAGAWHRMRYITLPLIRPFLAVALTIEVLSAMQIFASVYVLTRGGPAGSTASVGYFVWSEAFEGHRVGYASAVGLVMWLILIVLSMANYRIGRVKDTS